MADTREQVAELNTAIRDRLVADGRVDDQHATVTAAGEWIGVGDRVVTRRNDRGLDVANRDTWIVTAVGRDGGLLVTPAVTPPTWSRGTFTELSPRAGAGPRVLPADYVTAHVELGLRQHRARRAGRHRDRRAPGGRRAHRRRVGLRGDDPRPAGQHRPPLAANVEEAREQWIAVFARDRADLGPAHAAQLAAAEAARYAPARPLEDVWRSCSAAWTGEQRCRDTVADLQLRREVLRATPEPHAESTHRLTARQAASSGPARGGRRPAARTGRRRARSTPTPTGIQQQAAERWHDRTQGGPAGRPGRPRRAGPPRAPPRRRGQGERAAHRLASRSWAPHLPALTAEPFRLPELAAGPDHPLEVEAGLRAAGARNATTTGRVRSWTGPATTTTTPSAAPPRPTTPAGWPRPPAPWPPPASSSPAPERACPPSCRAGRARPAERLAKEFQAWRAATPPTAPPGSPPKAPSRHVRPRARRS